MEKCLITGAAGFIGSHLCTRLTKLKYKVIGVDSFEDYYPRDIKEKNLREVLKYENFEFIEGNLLCLDIKKLLEGVDYIFHLAAQPGVRASWGEKFEIYVNNNILATQRLLEAGKSMFLKKFVYASSSSVYGNTKELPMSENTICKPVSPYGATKLAGEHLCQLYFMNYGIPITMLRYFTVYGPRQRPDMAFNKFIKAILKGEEIKIYGNGNQTRDFTYIDDVIEGTILAKELGKVGEVYNIGGGSRISINRVIPILEEIIGKPVKVSYVDPQKGDVRDTFADISKARECFNYNPTYDLKKGLKEEVNWLKKLQ